MRGIVAHARFDCQQACQPLMQVKQQIVLSATEAAEMILRVDDIIKVTAALLRNHFCNLHPSYLSEMVSICTGISVSAADLYTAMLQCAPRQRQG